MRLTPTPVSPLSSPRSVATMRPLPSPSKNSVTSRWPPANNSSMVALDQSPPAPSTNTADLEAEVRRLEQELERRRLEEQIQMLEKQLENAKKDEQAAISAAGQNNDTPTIENHTGEFTSHVEDDESIEVIIIEEIIDDGEGDYEEEDVSVEEIIEEVTLEGNEADDFVEVIDVEESSAKDTLEVAPNEGEQASQSEELKKEGSFGQVEDRTPATTVLDQKYDGIYQPAESALLAEEESTPNLKARRVPNTKPDGPPPISELVIPESGSDPVPDDLPAPKPKRGWFGRIPKPPKEERYEEVQQGLEAPATVQQTIKPQQLKSVEKKASAATTTKAPQTSVSVEEKPASKLPPFKPRKIPILPPSPEGKETSFERLLGPKLIMNSKYQKNSTLGCLKDQELVILYFGASWRRECKQFNALIGDFYKTCAPANNLEIVYISADRTLLEFKDCYGRMPFLAMPTGTTSIKNQLTQQLQVVDMPMAIVLDGSSGKVLSMEAAAEICETKRNDVDAGNKLIQQWKKAKGVAIEDLKADSTLRHGKLKRSAIYWQE